MSGPEPRRIRTLTLGLELWVWGAVTVLWLVLIAINFDEFGAYVLPPVETWAEP